MTRLTAVLAIGLAVPGARLPAQEVLWRHTTQQTIGFYQLTPIGSLVVATNTQMLALDPATGETEWTRGDLREWQSAGFDVLPYSPLAVLRRKNDIALINVGSGATVWDGAAQPLEKVRGYFDVPELNLLLLYGETPKSKETLVAVNVATGEVLWQQDDAFDKSPELDKLGGISTLSGHQPPLVDTDTSLILYVSKDGPIQLDARTGELRWRASALKGKGLPQLSLRYPPMLQHDGALFVPYEKKLLALHASDGSLLWNREENFKSSVTQMELTPHGLLVRGARPPDHEGFSKPDAFVDLLDTTTGESIWREPFTGMRDESAAPFLVVGDRVYLGDREHLSSISLQDGAILHETTYEFGGHEEPTVIEQRGAQIVLLSAQNLLSIDGQGAVIHNRHYPAPGIGLWTIVGQVALAVAAQMSQDAAQNRMANSSGSTIAVWFEYEPVFETRYEGLRDSQQYAFMYTKRPDSSGRDRFCLVRLGKEDGRELDRLWLDERDPDYVLDEVTGVVYVKLDDHNIVAHRFFVPGEAFGFDGSPEEPNGSSPP